MLFSDNEDSDREQESLLARQEQEKALAEERERFALDDQLTRAKKRKAEDEEWQAKQAAQVKKVGAFYNLFYRVGNTVMGAIQVAGTSLGFMLKLLPPLNAVVTGMFFIVDLVEALFISKEMRSHKAVKITNSIIGTALSTAAVVLTINPVTAPLGAALAAGAMAIASAKEAYFWFKASQELRKAEKSLNTARKQFYDFVATQHKDDFTKISSLNKEIKKITKLRKRGKIPVLDARPLLMDLKQQKSEIIAKIKHSMDTRPDSLLLRREINVLAATVETKKADRNEKRKSFFSTLISCVGATLLTVAAFVATAAIMSNPISLGIVGITLLGIVTAVAVKKQFFPSTPKLMPVNNALVENENEQVHETNDTDREHKEHVADTDYIVHLLASKNPDTAKKILESGIEYHCPVGLPPKPMRVSPHQALDVTVKPANDSIIDMDEFVSFKPREK